RGAAFEAAKPLQYAQPGLLHNLLGYSVAGHVQHGQAKQRAMVAIDQRLECPLVARAQRRDQAQFVGWPARFSPGACLWAPYHIASFLIHSLLFVLCLARSASID